MNLLVLESIKPAAWSASFSGLLTRNSLFRLQSSRFSSFPAATSTPVRFSNTIVRSQRSHPRSISPSEVLRSRSPWAVAPRLLPVVQQKRSLSAVAQAVAFEELTEEAEMTIGAGVQLVDGKLTALGKPILAQVPNNVLVSPDIGMWGVNGAFIGVTPGTPKNHRHVFPIGNFEGLRFMCSYRFKLWWQIQKMGTCGSEVPHETQFLLVESPSDCRKEETVYTVFLPLLEGPFRACLQGNPDNQLEMCIESGDPAVDEATCTAAVYVYSGTDPFKVISEAVRAVEDHSQSFVRRENKKLPGILDNFGWCTWDAFYTDVTAEGVAEGLTSLAAGGTPARFLIIDDGWQSTSADTPTADAKITAGTQFANRLTSIKENQKFHKKPSKMEEMVEGTNTSVEALVGLAELVRNVKSAYDLKYVYVWHALTGYWGGVHKSLEHYQPTITFPFLSPGVLANAPDMAVDSLALNGIGLVHPSKAFDFYNEMHAYLASAGVDGVKVDVQSIIESLGAGLGGRVALAKSFHAALEASILQNFPDNGCISCMSHSSDGIYSSKQTAVVRASDDFWPRDPASHTVHIAAVTYNSLFLGEFMQPDWDMFQSSHPQAAYHAAARAIGGCAVYVSDKPNQHDHDLLKKLVLPDGSVLRAKLPGRPTRDCLFSDPTKDGFSMLKIWNRNQYTGVLGAFNCQGASWCKVGGKYIVHDAAPKAVTSSIRAADLEGIAEVASPDWKGAVVLYAHNSDELVVLPRESSLPLSLETLKFEIFTMTPVKEISPGLSFAPVGLTNMFNSGGAITGFTTGVSEAGPMALLSVRGCGKLAAYCSQRPLRCTVDGVERVFDYQASEGRVTVELGFQSGHNWAVEFSF